MANASILEKEITHKIQKYCKENGFFLTKIRLVVARKLYELGRYETPVSLWLQLKKGNHSISLGSVYLCLKFLTDAGVADVRKVTDRQLEYRIQPDLKLDILPEI
jgi:Fe2+ or Zn2+ uptake regulation protein